jgi:Na+/H+-dicarboxylate symporter
MNEQQSRELHPRPLKRTSRSLAVLVRTRLWAQILVGMALGVLVGALVSPRAGFVPDQEQAEVIGSWLALPGLLFLQLISMIVLPLVFSSIILGLASSESTSDLRKVGLRVAPFFAITTVFACIVGLSVGALVKPGNFIPEEVRAEAVRAAAVEMAVPADAPPVERPSLAEAPQQIVNLLPASPIEAAVNRAMLQWVLFSLVVGIAVVQMSPKVARPLVDVLGAVQEICMIVIKWAMFIAPAAVFGLIAQITIRIGLEALVAMSAYMGAVILALIIVMMMFLLVAWVMAGVRPLALLSMSREVLLLAFATSSSAAVMPLSIKVAEEKLRVRTAIARFIVPLGATVNMAGTAAYQCVATMFLVQVFNIELSMGQMAMVVLTAVGASVGAPASPGVGIVILAMILGSVGVPPSGIALIIGVDRLLDMCRTSVNVMGDLVACAVMDKMVTPDPEPAPEIAPEIPA